jgi:hypothetical protein
MNNPSNAVFPGATIELTGQEVEAVVYALVAARDGKPDDVDDDDRAVLNAVLAKLPDAKKA